MRGWRGGTGWEERKDRLRYEGKVHKDGAPSRGKDVSAAQRLRGFS